MITHTRSRTWKVQVNTEPKITVVSFLHNLLTAKCILCNTSPAPFWNLDLRFSNPQRENTLRKVWPNSTIYQDRVKKTDPQKQLATLRCGNGQIFQIHHMTVIHRSLKEGIISSC